jgi:hypothetical protein
MKRTDFETRLGKLGLNLTVYGNAAYYGACENWSLSLQPYPGEDVTQAKLAVRAPAKERSVVVDTFLAAANVKKTPQIAQALEAGDEFRGKSGPKDVTFTSIDSELVFNVME